MKNSRPLITLISVFFFWGFVAASNTVLIGLFKKNFELTQFQSQLVDLAFYAAYFIGSLIYFAISATKGDPLNRIGYKKGLIFGLILSAIGALGFVPAGLYSSFPLMLISLFTIGLGFALQQIVANPYVIALGDPSTGAHRNMLAGGINSFGTTIGPLLLAVAIYCNLGGSDSSYLVAGTEKVPIELLEERTSNKTETLLAEVVPARESSEGKLVSTSDLNPTEVVALYGQLVHSKAKGLLLLFADKEQSISSAKAIRAAFPHERIPVLAADKEASLLLSDFKESKGAVSLEVKFLGVDAVILPSVILAIAFLLFALLLSRSQLPPITNEEKLEADFGALRYPQLLLGMLAIFIYVGVEVAIQSNMPELMRQEFGREANTTVHFISLYWGGLMIGRWVGALTVFNLSKTMRLLLTLVVPFIAFAVIVGVNLLKGSPLDELLKMIPFIFVLIAGFYLAAEKPARTMFLFGGLGALMMLIGLLTTGMWSVYFFLSGGLFCSVMWPCIFSLSIAGLGKYTSQGSSLLIMMILGGALIPPFQGFVSDLNGAVKMSYIIPLIGFLYLAFYGWKVKRVLKTQGIDYDAKVAAH